MPAPAVFAAALPGDLAALVTITRQRTLHYDHTAHREQTRAVLVHVVATAPDGRITRIRRVQDNDWDECDPARVPGALTLAVIPARAIDVPGAVGAVREHRTASGRPFAPFDSLAALRAALRPCLRATL